MTKRTLAAAAVLATGAVFPLAGIAVAQTADRDCADFAGQAEAQAAFEAVSGDPERLDGDDDGIACEDLADSGSTPAPEETTDTDGGTADTDGSAGTAQDDGQMPSDGVETGRGGTAGNDFEVLLPLSLAGGAALAAGGVVVMRRRAGRTG